jgi:hypothetical protein
MSNLSKSNNRQISTAVNTEKIQYGFVNKMQLLICDAVGRYEVQHVADWAQ